MPRKRRGSRKQNPFEWFRHPTRKQGEANDVDSTAPASKKQPPKRPGVLSALRIVLRRKHYSPQTERSYVAWARRYIRFHDLRHPREMGAAEITQFLDHLAVQRRVSASTQNQALSALMFFYRHVLGKKLKGVRKSAHAKQRRPLPVVMSPEEALSVLAHIDGPSQLVVALLYGSGLRLREALKLRLKDVDLSAPSLFVRGGKGNKDRQALLPRTLVEALRAQIEFSLEQHDRDLANGAGWVEMPGALDRKLRGAGRSPEWQWLFPATRCYHDQETGQTRRHYLHPSVIQRKVKAAARKAGILKRVSCHSFRHSFATALLNMDYDIRTIQKLLGHESVKTTMVYTHLQDDTVARVQSPMDRLGGGLDVAGSKGGGPGTSRKTQKNFNPEANENQHFEEKTEEEGEDS